MLIRQTSPNLVQLHPSGSAHRPFSFPSLMVITRQTSEVSEDLRGLGC